MLKSHKLLQINSLLVFDKHVGSNSNYFWNLTLISRLSKDSCDIFVFFFFLENSFLEILTIPVECITNSRDTYIVYLVFTLFIHLLIKYMLLINSLPIVIFKLRECIYKIRSIFNILIISYSFHLLNCQCSGLRYQQI